MTSSNNKTASIYEGTNIKQLVETFENVERKRSYLSPIQVGSWSLHDTHSDGTDDEMLCRQ